MDLEQDIVNRGEGNPGAVTVLARILREHGPLMYTRVAPNLGRGPDIWIKFKNECDKDLDELVKRYCGNPEEN